MRLGIIEVDKARVIMLGPLTLIGNCRRCGECCRRRGCPHLVEDEAGQRWTCSVYRDRPISCALWPMPDDATPEGCGFKWVETP